MKRALRLALFVAFFTITPGVGRAQEAPKVDLINVPHYVSSAGAPSPLAREKPAFKVSGIINPKARIELKGEKSALRLTPEQAAAFYATFSNVDDPEKLLLYRLEVKKGKRETAIITFGLATLSLTPKVDRPGIWPRDAVKTGDTSFKLVPGAALPPGEYAFFSDKQRVEMQVNDAFTFGVDAK